VHLREALPDRQYVEPAAEIERPWREQPVDGDDQRHAGNKGEHDNPEETPDTPGAPTEGPLLNR
jgi:hypothetical protein